MTNPTGPAATAVTRTLTRTVTIDFAPTVSLFNSFFHANEPVQTANTTCGFAGLDLNNEVVKAPFIAKGNVCLRGSAPGAQIIPGTTGSLEIEGILQTWSTAARVAAVQGGTTNITEAQIGGGCRTGGITSGAAHACTSTDRVYATTIGSSPQHLTRPTFKWADTYTSAAPGPMHPCDASLLGAGEVIGSPPAFDSLTGTPAAFRFAGAASGTATDITPASVDYTCRARDASGNIGELVWRHTPRRLTVNGTILFDTDWSPSASPVTTGSVRYLGNGTILCTCPGQVTWGNSTEKWCSGDPYVTSGGATIDDCTASSGAYMPFWCPAGIATCAADPSNVRSRNTLLLVFGGKNGPLNTNGLNDPIPADVTDIDFKASAAFQGVLYTVNTCHVHGAGSFFSGPLICGRINTAGLGDSTFTFPGVNFMSQSAGGGMNFTVSDDQSG